MKSQRKMSPKKLSLRNAKSENICTFATVEQMLRVPLSLCLSLCCLFFFAVPLGHLMRIRDVVSPSTVPATASCFLLAFSFLCLLPFPHLLPSLSVINDSTRGSWQHLLLSCLLCSYVAEHLLIYTQSRR